jgi:hypothetical protein
MPKDSSREAHFPAIEKKYGEKMAYWFKVMAKLEGKKYPEQIAHLKESYGFSQAHANALVMFSRGSESASQLLLSSTNQSPRRKQRQSRRSSKRLQLSTHS